MKDSPTDGGGLALKRVQALIITSHPGPSLAITALTTLLAAQAAPHGIGPALTAPALLAGQLSIGWSNDACDAGRDAAAGRADKPLARGDISAGAVWTAAGVGAAAGLAMALVIGPLTGGLYALAIALGWAYNLGVKSSLASGAMYLLGFGLMPAYAASTLPGHHAPRWQVTVAAALLGLGAHFANVLPDLAADKATGRAWPAPAGGRHVGAWRRARGRARAAAHGVGTAAPRRYPPLGGDPRAGRRAAARRGVGARHRARAVPRGDRHRGRRHHVVRRGGEALA